jgi:hypothetical protein
MEADVEGGDIVGIAVAVAAGICLGFAGTLPPRAAWLLRESLVSVYSSRSTKIPETGKAYLSFVPETEALAGAAALAFTAQHRTAPQPTDRRKQGL